MTDQTKLNEIKDLIDNSTQLWWTIGAIAHVTNFNTHQIYRIIYNDGDFIRSRNVDICEGYYYTLRKKYLRTVKWHIRFLDALTNQLPRGGDC